MIRCLAVDDEAYATKMMAGYIAKVPYFELAGIANNVVDALGIIQNDKIDLVFMDIQMPELNGIQFLKLCGNKCKVILTTAYAQYALDGFEHDVVDYLLKPIAFDRFLKAAAKACSVIEATKLKAVIEPLPAAPVALAANDELRYMFVKGESKNKFLKIDYQDILYIEGLKNYVCIYTKTQRVVTYQSLRDLSTQLPQQSFQRVHKSYIVSMDKIRMVDGYTIFIGDQAIPIGETYRNSFLKLVKEI
ncbi:LytTR family two component transcriptional regulator [Mucilaginibacter gracilis]|uniref:LytTR family two component transcriptional regulator n=1 Tax=Mucilaginibacter gracilis TaxID=423350 RepID=A0A495J566_9SPHI|nr:LytTR family DNA-binding domain-containing protein [Mucilaginibacter gracilis]RKR83548.1 LytTR family two component transcriptional regulator [Mucilaginibacter gracilis]